MKSKLLLLAGLCLLTSGLRANDYAKQIESARVARIDALTRPDGWLTLIGRVALPSGASTIGRAATNRIALKAGPEFFGTIVFTPVDARIIFTPASDAGVLVNGSPATASVELRPGAQGRRPTFVTAGTVGFYVTESAGQTGLTVRDLAHPRLIDFPGIDYFSIEPAWRVEGDWVPFAEPRTLRIGNIAGEFSPTAVHGKAVFKHAGRTIELLPMTNPDGTLLFVFADETSGKDTYAMRFLPAGPPREGKVVLDFNLAENPPCAFSPLAVCPLPPRENQLSFPVTAGERVFHHPRP